MALSATTKLQAVNIMLGTIGEAPTANITDSTLPYEVSTAINVLDEVVKEMQQDAYVFNYEEDVSLAVNSSNKIPVTANYLRIESTSTNVEYVIRDVGGSPFLYDMVNKTDTFSGDLSVNVIYALDFEDLPEAAKRYSNIRAARLFADRYVGSKDIRAFSERDELEAKAKLMNYEAGVDKVNMIYDNPETSSILNRGGTGRRTGGGSRWL